MFEGKLNDIQLKNVKMFPLIFFNGVSKVAVDYNLDMGKTVVNYEIYETETKNDEQKKKDIKYDIELPKNQTSISYHITLDEKADNSFLEKRFAALETSLANLFWSGIKIKVFFNEKLVHESKNGK